jgi:hypothetical protein
MWQYIYIYIYIYIYERKGGIECVYERDLTGVANGKCWLLTCMVNDR